ncbi:MAG: hypothetical protein Q7K57_05300 [Burkholderiaceae bacterium]|nr:hypothetical protein [Burkholderiaceae bacterium]
MTTTHPGTVGILGSMGPAAGADFSLVVFKSVGVGLSNGAAPCVELERLSETWMPLPGAAA